MIFNQPKKTKKFFNIEKDASFVNHQWHWSDWSIDQIQSQCVCEIVLNNRHTFFLTWKTLNIDWFIQNTGCIFSIEKRIYFVEKKSSSLSRLLLMNEPGTNRRMNKRNKKTMIIMTNYNHTHIAYSTNLGWYWCNHFFFHLVVIIRWSRSFVATEIIIIWIQVKQQQQIHVCR